MLTKAMVYKSQQFPSRSVSTRGSWGYMPANLQGIRLVNPWIDYDSRVRTGLAHRLNWNKVLGLAFATALSASIWTGIVLVVERIWR